jgi:hypothetical protein
MAPASAIVIHVNDLAEAHVLGVEHLENGSSTALNLGTGQGSSVRELISTIERITSRPLPQRVAPRCEGDPPQSVADPSLAQKVLGWKARRSLHVIVATAWKWDQSHRKSMAPTFWGSLSTASLEVLIPFDRATQAFFEVEPAARPSLELPLRR